MAHRSARLAISGVTARWRAPTGREDVMLAEGRPDDPALALALVRAVAQFDDLADPGTLPVPDLDALVCHIRCSLLGDRVTTDIVCHNPDCRQRIDVSFSLSDYLAHHHPRARPRAGAVAGRPRWFRLGPDGAAGAFRLPCFADLVETGGAPDPVEALALRCFDPPAPPPPLRRRAERTMAAMAPMLAGPLQAHCAECAAPIATSFAARTYCMQELCDRTRFVFEDVDVIAARYHWSEAAILRLPVTRRNHYADMARHATAGAM